MLIRIIKVGIICFSNWLILTIFYTIIKDPFIAWANNTQIVDYGVKTNFIYCGSFCVFLYLLFFIFKLIKFFKQIRIVLSSIIFALFSYILCFLLTMFLGNAYPSIVWKPVLLMFVLGFLLPLGHSFWEKVLSKTK